MKTHWRGAWNDVGQILRTDWDPIGAVTPPDEYDCCVGPVVSMLVEKASLEAIADYLEIEAAGHFGCPMPRDAHERVAVKLKSVDVSNVRA